MDILEQIGKIGIIPVVVIDDEKDAVPLAKALIEGGLPAAEVTFRTAAAEGAIGIAEKANKVRQKPLRVILNGLGKDAAQVISRINGFTYVETEYDYFTGELKEVFRKCYSKDPESSRARVNCYGA